MTRNTADSAKSQSPIGAKDPQTVGTDQNTEGL